MSRNPKKRHSYVAFYPSDWRSGTSHLPRAMRSAYFDLCLHMWEFAEPVSKLQASMILSDLPNAEEIIDQLVAIGKLQRDDDGFLSNEKALEEGNKALDLWLKKSSGGQTGARVRGVGEGSRKGQKTADGQGLLEGVPQQNVERRTKSNPDANASGRARARARPRAPASGLPDWLPLDEWNAYLEMRKAKKAKPTDRAVELLVKKLDGMRAKGIDLTAVLNQSIMNNWTDVFEPKPDRGKPKTGVHRRDFDEPGYYGDGPAVRKL